ncbi:MAG TPA: helix-turn-helix domain-containing protein [Anaerolineaceae bacterium]|nr:helix-turn-helix domain-containing protein [Anaerolineaceae bacterium]
MSLVDLILHPVRMRLMMTLSGAELTPQQLSERLPEVPPATLYRHVSALHKAGLLHVVAERPVRGAIEKVYTADPHRSVLGTKDLEGLKKDDHLRLFIAFMSGLLRNFQQYLETHSHPDYARDGVGFRQIPLHLDDEEFIQMAQALNKALIPFVQKEPAPHRKLRYFATIVMPVIEAEDQSES